MNTQEFSELVWGHYARAGRDLLWRHPEQDGTYDPYKIMISEIMLQQTQVIRVTAKYSEFLEAFPDIYVLAAASLGDVLRSWQGLGYNRRAKFLHESAQRVVNSFAGIIPRNLSDLVSLPGIGENTAAAILVYAFNQPVTFIETNIRTVYIHHFFQDSQLVSDKDISKFAEQTIDTEHPREWFWALMDYGAHLKTTIGNVSVRSKHYIKQSQFMGSKRQIRGEVLRRLAADAEGKEQFSSMQDTRLGPVLEDLEKEGLIVKNGGLYCLA